MNEWVMIFMKKRLFMGSLCENKGWVKLICVAYIGDAPFGTTQNDNNDCCDNIFIDMIKQRVLDLPRIIRRKGYGLRKKNEEKRVHIGDSNITVVNITKRWTLIYLKEINLGVVYKGVPIDKFLVPWIIFIDSVD